MLLKARTNCLCIVKISNVYLHANFLVDSKKALKHLIGLLWGHMCAEILATWMVDFQDFNTVKDFNWFFSTAKSDLEINKSPGTVVWAVTPQLGMWMIGSISKL